MNEQHPDSGFTLVEVLLVILILGLLAAVVVAGADHMTSKAESASCREDRYAMQVAAESYFAQHRAEVIPPTGTTSPYAQTLVDAALLREVSTMYEVEADGTVVPIHGGPCDD